jgi:hypothetical protein
MARTIYSRSRRWKVPSQAVLQSEWKRYRAWVIVLTLLFAVVLIEVVFAIRWSEGSQKAAVPHVPVRSSQSSRLPLSGSPSSVAAPVSTLLPSAASATTLAPTTEAEQAAFTAGQRSCLKHGGTGVARMGAAEQAAFAAGHQWCMSAAGRRSSGNGG